jgi:hypothetical protein
VAVAAMAAMHAFKGARTAAFVYVCPSRVNVASVRLFTP